MNTFTTETISGTSAMTLINIFGVRLHELRYAELQRGEVVALGAHTPFTGDDRWAFLQKVNDSYVLTGTDFVIGSMLKNITKVDEVVKEWVPLGQYGKRATLSMGFGPSSE